MTGIGKIEVTRSYRTCPTCGEGEFPADDLLGLAGSFTRRARRQICHVGIDNSFERGERTLQELAGWSVDAETIRRLCHAESAECRKSKSGRLDVAASFGKTPGNWELQIDAFGFGFGFQEDHPEAKPHNFDLTPILLLKHQELVKFM